VLPQAVEDVVEEIRSDHTSGANRIARKGLKGLEALLAEAALDPGVAREAARYIAAAQETNAALYNVCHLFAALVAEGHPPADVLARLRGELESARPAIARNFLKVAPDRGSVVTLTYSDNVLACLQAAHEQGRVARVVVLESRPLNEGRFLAIALKESGLATVLAPDPLGPSLVAESDYVLVGADSVLRDGSIVNKTGTYALALAAADRRKPMYVACETLKFDARYDAASWPGAPDRPGREVWENPPEAIDLANRYFEVVPGKLVTMVATERGSYGPDTIRTMLTRANRQE
jgi:translation initiation factor eIF-2B subunit delta